MDDRAKRIVDTAMTLAERDGYHAVRLRDVAASADVALGTVYKRFASKEEILIAALEQESDRVMLKLAKKPVPGNNAEERIRHLFSAVTKGLLRRPNLTKALIRSILSGDPNVTERVVSFHAMVTSLIIAALRGEAAAEHTEWGGEANEAERNAASILEHVWFSALVGWAGDLHDVAHVLEQVEMSAKMILKPKS